MIYYLYIRNTQPTYQLNLKQLTLKVDSIIVDLKDNGIFPKENNLIDYKLELNIREGKTKTENFLINFAKDILAFSNSDGGIILIGIKEDKVTGFHDDVGLNKENIEILRHVDLNEISQKFEKITKVGVSIDLQVFQISTRRFYYLLVEKQSNVLIPINDFIEYRINKGAVIYRASSKNELANNSTSDFNRFIQIKANEKSKEFMEIWSKLLPEMVDINPREVLILNPMQNKVYGFNSKDNILSSSDVEIDKTDNGVFNIILNAITAGEIGKITTNEGKPLFKIVGEFQNNREHIILTSLEKEVRKKSIYKFTNAQLKCALHYLKWVDGALFKVENPPNGTVNEDFNRYLWVETTDDISQRSKIFFSSEAIAKLVEVINNELCHLEVFNRTLERKK